jgi:methanogenic corrinoid protein MtbC1
VALPAVADLDLLEARRAYLDALGRGDRRRAIEVVFDLLYGGVPADTVLIDLVGGGQVEVGLAWQEARWTIAQEHRASAVAEAVLEAVAQHALTATRVASGGRRGAVTVASTEGEWHGVPGRLVSEILRLHGFDVAYVGPSVPAADLARALGPGSPEVVAVSCSMPSCLTGAWRTITALRAAGKTIVCGGRGFGPGGAWGVALGADAGAGDIRTGMEMLDSAIRSPVGAPRPDAVRPDVAAEVSLAIRELDSVIAAATHLAVTRWSGLAGDPVWVREARGMLGLTARSATSAALVGDERIMIDHVRWAESLLVARGQPVDLVREALSLLITAMPADLPRSIASARAGLTATHPSPSTALPASRP